MLRIQMAGIYAHSGLAKLGVEDWVNGTAMYYIVRDPSFGASGPVRAVMAPVTENPLGAAFFSWGTIVAEIAMAVLLLGGTLSRRAALWMAISLHVGILAVIGLWSFAMIMIGAVVIAAGPSWSRERTSRKKTIDPASTPEAQEISNNDRPAERAR